MIIRDDDDDGGYAADEQDQAATTNATEKEAKREGASCVHADAQRRWGGEQDQQHETPRLSVVGRSCWPTTAPF